MMPFQEPCKASRGCNLECFCFSLCEDDTTNFWPFKKCRAKTTKRFVEFKVWVVFPSLVASEGLFIYLEPNFKRILIGKDLVLEGCFAQKIEAKQVPGIGSPEAFRKNLAGGNSNIFYFHPENWGR